MNGKIKRLLILSMILILSVFAGCILSSCETEKESNENSDNVKLVRVWRLTDEGKKFVTRKTVTVDRLEGSGIHIAIPTGYSCPDLHTEDGKVVYRPEESWIYMMRICDVPTLKELLASSEIIDLFAEFVPIPFNLVVDLKIGCFTWEYEAEPSVKTEDNYSYYSRIYQDVTIEDMINNIEYYLPVVWGVDRHFYGWTYFGNNSVVDEGLVWVDDHYEVVEDRWDDPSGVTDLTDFIKQWFDYRSNGKGRFYAYSKYPAEADCNIYVYDTSSDESAVTKLKGNVGDNLLTNDSGFSDYQPETTRKFEHSFFAWSKSRTEYIPFDGTVTGDMKLFWREIGYKTIFLEPMNGDSSVEITIYDDEKKDFPQGWELSVPYGYVFGGWYKTRDCTGESVSVEENLKFSEVEHGATYYVKWVKG